MSWIAVSGIVGSNSTAVFTVVGIPLGISRTAKLPALPRQLVVLIVPLAGAQYRIAVLNLLAMDQAAKRIIGIQIDNCIAALGLRQAVEPAFTVKELSSLEMFGSAFFKSCMVIQMSVKLSKKGYL